MVLYKVIKPNKVHFYSKKKKIIIASNLSIHEHQGACLASSKERKNKSFLLNHEELKCMFTTKRSLIHFPIHLAKIMHLL